MQDELMTPVENIAKKMLSLLDKPNAERLQATVCAMACLGVYSPPFRKNGKEIAIELLIQTTDAIEATGAFPLTTTEDCMAAFNAGLEVYDMNIVNPMTPEETARRDAGHAGAVYNRQFGTPVTGEGPRLGTTAQQDAIAGRYEAEQERTKGAR